jgi:TIR domain
LLLSFGCGCNEVLGDKTMSSLFISYSRKDLNVVQQLEQALLAKDHAVWRDQENIYGGQRWPKAIGEAIASRDFFLLVWSQYAASSYFVEFEWNTALALKKVILPCLLDDTPLPPALRAINGVACKDLQTGLPRVLQALQQPLSASDPSHADAVINKLQTIPAAAPEQVVQAAKTIFDQQHWNVQGNVYHAAGDIHVTIAPPTEKPAKKFLERWRTWVVFISAVIVLVGALLVNFGSTEFSGRVVEVTGKPIVGAEVIALGYKAKGQTDKNGEFSFKVKEKSGTTIKILIVENGEELYNGRETLPGGTTITIQRDLP